MSEPLGLEPIRKRSERYMSTWANSLTVVGIDRRDLLAEVERLRGEVARQAEQIAQLWPHYFSTYCIHGEHGQCRLTCKVCGEPCFCECHEGLS